MTLEEGKTARQVCEKSFTKGKSVLSFYGLKFVSISIET